MTGILKILKKIKEIAEPLSILAKKGIVFMNIYLDDLRKCPEGFVLARTVEEAIVLLRENDVDILTLDHDLGEDECGNLLPTGYDLVKYMCENGLFAKKIYMHTSNPVGRDNMVSTLRAAQKRGFIPEFVEVFHYSITKNIYE